MRLTDLVTPLKPLEAMAQGRLVVASDVGGHKELIRDNETGRLFKANDSDNLAETVLDLLNQPEQWNKLREAGRLYVEQERNWTKSVSYYENIYKKLI
jgi:glycosyltransferase involved in cell wall biosynthesis